MLPAFWWGTACHRGGSDETGVRLLLQETSALAAGISKAEHVTASHGSRLALAEQRVNELQASKQDTVTAVTMDMVNARVANVRPRPATPRPMLALCSSALICL